MHGAISILLHIRMCSVQLKVFTVDWSPDGERVASGGRDRVLKM